MVQVAQKFLARSDLDFLLTEYYKKRLESQLKNRKTHRINHILTEPTELIGLRLPTDWTSNINPLSAKLFLFTPPPSPLSLPLSVNFPTPLVFPHNLDPERQVSSSYFIVTPLSVGTMEQSLKKGVKGKVTPVESISSKCSLKDTSSASIPTYSRAVMRYSILPGALFFEGSNITDFFESYSRMCTDYQVDEQEKIKQLSWYCKLFTGKYIETLISSSETSWVVLCKVLREKYNDQDLNQ